MVSELYATEIDLPAPAEEVFRHLTDPAAMVRWMGQHATLRPVPGGAFEIDINGVPVRGHYLEIDPPRRVLVSWGVVGNPALPPGPPRSSSPSPPPPPAPACAWSTAACPLTRHPCTPPAGIISSVGSPWPQQARTPAGIPGIRPPADRGPHPGPEPLWTPATAPRPGYRYSGFSKSNRHPASHSDRWLPWAGIPPAAPRAFA